MNPAPFTPLEKTPAVRTGLKEVNQLFERGLKSPADFLTGFIIFYTYRFKSEKSPVAHKKGAG